MEDALISAEGFAILSGAGLIAAKDANSGEGMFVHTTSQVKVQTANTIVIEGEFACWNNEAGTSVATGATYKGNPVNKADYYNSSADIFVMVLKNGEVAAEPCIPVAIEYSVKTEVVNGKTIETPVTTITCYSHDGNLPADKVVLVDYYMRRVAGAQQIEITADKFGGNYYLEASTLFRRESDGVDMPAEFVIPNCKVQSNFTFSMASSGDPSEQMRWAA